MACKKALPLIEDFDNIPEEALVPVEEQPYPIPEHWKWVRLGCVLYPMETRKPSGKLFTYIDIEAIDNKRQIIASPKTLESGKAPSRASRAVHPGDTLFSLVRPYLMNIACVDPQFADAIASTGFYVCQPTKTLNPQYLFYLLCSPPFVDRVTEKMRGDNSPSVKNTDFTKMPIQLPPLAEQKRIVEYIEQTNAKIDDIIQRLNQYIEDASDRRTKLIQAGVSGVLTRNWRENQGRSIDEWSVKKLGDLGRWGGGGTPRKTNKSYWDGGNIRWVTPKDMKSEEITDTLDRITELGAEETSARKYEGRALCIVARSGILRRILPVGLIDDTFTVNQDMKVLHGVSENHLVDFIFWFIKAHEANIRETCSKSGTTVESIDFDKLKEYELSLPSRAEQEEIVGIITSGLETIDSSVEFVTKARAKVESLKQQIVCAALTGHLES